MAMTPDEYLSHVASASSKLVEAIGNCEIAIVLGSGLNGFTSLLSNTREISFSDIPHMIKPSVKGHSGLAVSGDIEANGRVLRVMCFAGRIHPYEGYGTEKVNFIVRVCAKSGVKIMILTNSSGGSMPGMTSGCVMLIRDHVRLAAINPISEAVFDGRFGPRLVDTSELYSRRLGKIALEAASEIGIKLFEGAYAFTGGPTYETGNEVKAGMVSGCVAFGMSTVTEVVSASACGMEVLGMSLITNVAAGIVADHVLTHAEVTSAANESGAQFQKLLKTILQKMADPKEGISSSVPVLKNSVDNRAAPKEFLVGTISRPYPELFHVRTTADAILAMNGKNEVPSGVLINATKSESLKFLTDVSTFRLIDLPTASLFFRSASALCGFLHFGVFRNRRICVLDLEYEGLDPYESMIIFSSFSLIGAHACVAIVNAVKPHGPVSLSVLHEEEVENTTGSEILAVADVFDRSQVPYVPFPDLDSSLSHDVFSSQETGINRLQNSIFSHSFNIGNIVSWAGPSLPTRTESALSNVIGAAAVSIFNPSSYLISLQLNWSVSVFANVSSDWKKHDQVDLEQFFIGLSKMSSSRETVPRSVILSSDAGSSGKFVSLVQEDHDLLARAATHFLQLIGNCVPKVAVMIDSCACALDIFEEASARFFGKDIYGWKESFVGGASENWEFAVSRHGLTGNSVLLISNTLKSCRSIPSFYQLQFVTRLLKLVSVEKVLLLAPVCSTDVTVPVGSLVLIKDHVNISGFNPLFGHNVDSWGTRFPDMSDVYSTSMRSKMRKIVPAESIILHVATPMDLSATSGTFATKVNATTICCGLVPQMIVARHMQLEAMAIGFVSRNCTDGSSEMTMGQNNSEEFSKLLASIFN